MQVSQFFSQHNLVHTDDSVTDPGFSAGGRGPVGGYRPLTRVLFGENACKNERTGSGRGCTRNFCM